MRFGTLDLLLYRWFGKSKRRLRDENKLLEQEIQRHLERRRIEWNELQQVKAQLARREAGLKEVLHAYGVVKEENDRLTRRAQA